MCDMRMGGDSGWEDEKEMERVLREFLINMKYKSFTRYVIL